jgi:protein SCO1
MHFPRAFLSLAFLALMPTTAWSGSNLAEEAPLKALPKELQEVGITEHLGDLVTASELTFRNEAGEPVKLSSFLGKEHPVLLTLAYYGCPSLCTLTLNGVVNSLKRLELTPGKQFDVVIVSIHPKETHALASAKKEAMLKAYGKPETAAGWHFLTGDEDQIQRLAKQVGFGYKYDPKQQEYAHSAALYVLTPEGKISRYLYGIDYPPSDVRLALVEASNGKIGTVIDRLLLFCYRYDPQSRKYSVYLTRLMQTAAGLTVLVLGTAMFLGFRARAIES